MPNGIDVDGQLPERLEVLNLACQIHQRTYLPGEVHDLSVLETADRYFGWLIGPTRLRVTFGPVTDKHTGAVIVETIPEGTPVQITNTQKVTVTLGVIDRGGENLPDDPTTTDDNASFEVDDTAVLEPQPTDDGRTCALISRRTGTAILTITVGGKIHTEAIDVLHSEADRLEVTFGEPQEKDGSE